MDIEKLKTDIKEFLKSTEFELYGIEYVKERKTKILRIFIDKPTTVTINDCVNATNLLNPFLDELDPIEGEYMLEVSSPGAEKELRSKEAILNNIGRNIYLETYEQKLSGKLIAFNGEVLTVSRKNKQINIDYMDINYIRLTISLGEGKR
jgi:ribosome maturation factor RimP